MLISKNFLKQIVKEEIQKLKEEQQLKEKTITITPKQFLDLTTTPKIMSELEKRFENLSYDPFKISKEKPYLTLDHNGKVLSHEGRLRAFILNKNNVDTYQVDLNFPSSLDINKNNLMLFNQFDDEKSITLNKSDIKNDIPEMLDFTGFYENRLKLNEKIKNIYNSLIKNSSKEEVVNTLNNELSKYTVYELVDGRRKEERPLSIKMENIYNIKIYNPKSEFYSVFPTDKKIELVK